MSNFKVGDVVEVVRSTRRPEWIGRILVVTGIDPGPGIGTDGVIYEYGVYTSPAPPNLASGGWAPVCLRRIDPPDFNAPVTTEREREREQA